MLLKSSYLLDFNQQYFLSLVAIICVPVVTSALSFKKYEKTHLENYEATEIQNNSVEPPLRIGSFNIQTLGKKKLKNTDVMINVAKIVHRYDLIFIMELITDDSRLLSKLLFDINKFAPEGVTYNMTHSGVLIGNEMSAFIYRTSKFKVLKSESYRDQVAFYRTPFFALFETSKSRDMKKFGAVGLHVKPSEAVREINALAGVYDYLKIKYQVEDVMFMGDFNADCSYVSEKDWNSISLWTRPEFTWVIGNNLDTTTNHRSCALDRFVYAGENMNAGVIMSSANIFNFQMDFDLSIEEVRAVSDHWPIEVQIRGSTSDVVNRYLSSDTCFKVCDRRTPPKISKSRLLSSLQQLQFQVTESAETFYLKKNEEYFVNMLESIKNLRLKLPEAISKELMEAAVYKSEHNVLRDESSNADEPDIWYKIELAISNASTVLNICKTTTIN